MRMEEVLLYGRLALVEDRGMCSCQQPWFKLPLVHNMCFILYTEA